MLKGAPIDRSAGRRDRDLYSPNAAAYPITAMPVGCLIIPMRPFERYAHGRGQGVFTASLVVQSINRNLPSLFQTRSQANCFVCWMTCFTMPFLAKRRTCMEQGRASATPLGIHLQLAHRSCV